MEARYANYFQVGFNAGEFVMDFGQQYEDGPAVSHTRIIMHPVRAKVLSEMLLEAIEKYEKTVGQIDKQEF